MGLRIEKETNRLILRFDKGHLGYQKAMLDVSKMALSHTWEEDENEIRLIYYHEEKTLKNWIRSDPSAMEMESFFKAVVQLDETVDCFLLEEGRLLFDPEWISWEPETESLRVVYSPFDPYALSAVPFWNRLTGYFHKVLITGVLSREDTAKVILMAERAAYLRRKKDPAWAGSWGTKEKEEEPLSKIISKETSGSKEERMAEREKALDELIKAGKEGQKDETLRKTVRPKKNESSKDSYLRWKKQVLKWKERFPIALKD